MSSKPEYYCDYGHKLQPGVAQVWYCACFGGFYVRKKLNNGWKSVRVTVEELTTGYNPITEVAARLMVRAQIRHMLAWVDEESMRRKEKKTQTPHIYTPITDDEMPF